MYAIENCLPRQKRCCPEGFLGNVSFGEKNLYKFAKQTNEAFKTLAALTKGCEIELPFMLTNDFFFFSFQSPVKDITLNEKLSTFSSTYHFLFFLFNLIVCCN